MKISVIIPVYGCSEALIELHARLQTVLMQISEQYEIILVNDDCPQNSWKVIKKIADKDHHTIGINLSRNFGQHSAISAGLDLSQGEWIVVMDCDLQDQPEEIHKLFAKSQEGYDIVFAKRTFRQDSFFKRLSSVLFYKIFSYLTNTKQDYSIANFGIYNRQVINAICNMKEHMRYFPAMVRWIGFKNTAIVIDHAARSHGQSSYNLKKLLQLSIDVIITFSEKPLRITTNLGLCISIISLLSAIVIFIKKICFGISVEGWASLMVSLWFLSGLIIFFMGMIGIYIGKVFNEVKNRPVYIIQEKYCK